MKVFERMKIDEAYVEEALRHFRLVFGQPCVGEPVRGKISGRISITY